MARNFISLFLRISANFLDRNRMARAKLRGGICGVENRFVINDVKVAVTALGERKEHTPYSIASFHHLEGSRIPIVEIPN